VVAVKERKANEIIPKKELTQFVAVLEVQY
jgi:hypothetical protein